MEEILLVSFGAILGANTRFEIYNKFKKLYLNRNFSLLIINTFASFCLGIFLSIAKDVDTFVSSTKLALFFSIGFLGSLSTFSSFVYDLFELSLQFKFIRALNLFIFSSSLGVIAFAFGFSLSKN